MMMRFCCGALLGGALLASVSAWGAAPWRPAGDWPVLKHYDQDHLFRIALPLGGIGCGSFSLGGRGEFTDFVMMNATRHDYLPGAPYFSPFAAVTVKGAKAGRVSRQLRGATYQWERQQFTGQSVTQAGFPRFREASFDGSFPFGTVKLADPAVPVKVAIRAFSPFVPNDEEASGLPIASLAYEVTNTSAEPLEATVAISLPNFIGTDGTSNAFTDKAKKAHNANAFRDGGTFRGIAFMPAAEIDRNHAAWGTMALVTEEKEGVSARLALMNVPGWASQVAQNEEWWRDFTDNGEFNVNYPQRARDPVGSLGIKKTLKPGETKVFTFHFTWHFPNRYGWGKTNVGNWYTTRYRDAWDVAAKTLPRLADLEARSLAFARAFASCSYPAALKERAAMNLAVYKGSGEFRDAGGRFMGYEGVGATFGCSSGSTTHVFNYEQATGILFPRLARTKRDVEFNYMMHENGQLPCHQALPLDGPKPRAACRHLVVDGQCGVIMKLYRDWLQCGDKAWLAGLLPKLRTATRFLWSPEGFDRDADGLVDVKDGQFNTYDICFMGPNPLAQFWYLGALRSAEELGKAGGDVAFATECRNMFEKGRRLTDEKLFNGDYFIQLLEDPERHSQMGEGCLSDQLLGQQTAHLLGLGYLADPAHVRKAAASVAKYNLKADLYGHFNYLRTYAMDEEPGLLIMTNPRGEVKYPFTYWSEVWTGIEYTTAAEFLYEGLEKEAVRVVEGVSTRYNGLNRNPYSEIEWGFNYVRSLASWNVVQAWSDFHWNAAAGEMTFGARPGRYFWSVGGAWGVADVAPRGVTVHPIEGRLALKSVKVNGKAVTFAVK